MSLLIEALLFAFVLIVGVALCILTVLADGEKVLKEQELPPLTKDQRELIEQVNKNREQGIVSAADKRYQEKLERARRAAEKRNRKVSLACPNCGAPLNAIYERCEFCDMSYREASDAQD